MKKWFRSQWVRFLVFRKNFVTRIQNLHEKPLDHRYTPKPWEDARPSLDEYADDQIKALLFAVKEYKKAKANPTAFVEHYFSAKIAPRPAPDTWVYDLIASPTGKEPFEFTWSGK